MVRSLRRPRRRIYSYTAAGDGGVSVFPNNLRVLSVNAPIVSVSHVEGRGAQTKRSRNDMRLGLSLITRIAALPERAWRGLANTLELSREFA